MIDPTQRQMLQGLLEAAGSGDTSERDLRTKQGRLTFAATISALRGNCQCETCQLLRQAIDFLLGDARKELQPDAPSVNPPA